MFICHSVCKENENRHETREINSRRDLAGVRSQWNPGECYPSAGWFKNNLYFTLMFIQHRLGKETQRIIHKPENTIDYKCIFHEGYNEQYLIQV